MGDKFNVAVVGATGLVGQTLLEILAERQFPIQKLFPLASSRSAGEPILFNNKPVLVEDLATFDFTQVAIAFFSAGGAVSAEYVPKAVAAGCVVIDNTSHFRYDDDVPLVVPEVNPEQIGRIKDRGIIANPNCSTIQLVVALKPIYDAVGIRRINLATYQSVSGAGRKGVEELASQTAHLLNGQAIEKKAFPVQIAFNTIPQIDVFQDNGYTKEEMKMVWETRKILGDDKIQVNPTAVRVPVFFGHAVAAHVETDKKISAQEVKKLFQNAPGLILVDSAKQLYPTQAIEAANHDGVFVGRIREDISHPNGINFWVVADNVRKGAALNAVQIAEMWQKK